MVFFTGKKGVKAGVFHFKTKKYDSCQGPDSNYYSFYFNVNKSKNIYILIKQLRFIIKMKRKVIMDNVMDVHGERDYPNWITIA